MKNNPIVNKAAFSPNVSYSLMSRECIALVFPFHVHNDFQISYIIEGKGIIHAGDGFYKYKSGDLIFLGPNLPHSWSYDNAYRSRKGNGKVIIIHFSQNFAGTDFINLPELLPLRELLQHAFRGIVFGQNVLKSTHKLFAGIEQANSFNKFISLIQLLGQLASNQHFTYIAGSAFDTEKLADEEQRVTRILNYLRRNYREQDMCLAKMAKLMSMSVSAFSKYFKKITGKKYIDVLIELRLSNAYKLLTDSDLNISDVAYRCGFNNLSNFNKLFKKNYGLAPLAVRKNHIINNLHEI